MSQDGGPIEVILLAKGEVKGMCETLREAGTALTLAGDLEKGRDFLNLAESWHERYVADPAATISMDVYVPVDPTMPGGAQR